MIKGTKIKSRDGQLQGISTGTISRCPMSGCAGSRIFVKWDDGKLTKPCSKGMKSLSDSTFQIM